MKELGEMRPLEDLVVTKSATRAVMGTAFTEEISEITDAVRSRYRPTTLEVHTEILSAEVDDEEILSRPILVWDMIWLHGDSDMRPPEFHQNHIDSVATHRMEEYTVINFGGGK